MKTRVLTVDPVRPETSALKEASLLLRCGGLVAFPTETVYGLGANALDSAAVESIYAAKGRPANNPVIVHVAEPGDAPRISRDWPQEAEKLAERFWPGPLTLVLPRSRTIPAVLSAGGDTIAVRVPAHPVARALLRRAEVPVAAPSANRSTTVSPTEAAHVLRSLDGRFDLLLDGGRCPGGIESTVLDLTTSPPAILRPGLITAPSIESVVGPITWNSAPTDGGALRSPGMLTRHYAPSASMEIVVEDGAERASALARAGLRVGWVKLGGSVGRPGLPALVIELPEDAEGYAAELYAALHAMDEAGVDRIILDAPPDMPDWQAVNDRLTRATAEQ